MYIQGTMTPLVELSKLSHAEICSIGNIPKTCEVCKPDGKPCTYRPTWTMHGVFRCGHHKRIELPLICNICRDVCGKNAHKRELCAKSTEQVKTMMSTPGIPTLIASHMDKLDDGLKGFFLLINESGFRHELEPTVQHKRDRFVCRELMKNIDQYLKTITKVHFKRQKVDLIYGMYAYICAEQDNLHLISDHNPNFPNVLLRRTNEFIEQNEFDGIATRMEQYKNTLAPYFERVMKDVS